MHALVKEAQLFWRRHDKSHHQDKGETKAEPRHYYGTSQLQRGAPKRDGNKGNNISVPKYPLVLPLREK